jgi:hypothetical protein
MSRWIRGNGEREVVTEIFDELARESQRPW